MSYFDLDGDGQIDAMDSNCDGYADAVDIDGDGLVDALDSDFDGQLDVVDVNADGIADAVDLDGDGTFEMADSTGYDQTGYPDPTGSQQMPYDAPTTAYDAATGTYGPAGYDQPAAPFQPSAGGVDIDGDGVVDAYDTNGDGAIDTVAPMDYSTSGPFDPTAATIQPGYNGEGYPYMQTSGPEPYTNAEIAQGYSQYDTSSIEPNDFADDYSMISDNDATGNL